MTFYGLFSLCLRVLQILKFENLIPVAVQWIYTLLGFMLDVQGVTGSSPVLSPRMCKSEPVGREALCRSGFEN